MIKFCLIGVSWNYPFVTAVQDGSQPVNIIGKRSKIPRVLEEAWYFFVKEARPLLQSELTITGDGHERVFLAHDGRPAQHKYVWRCLTKPLEGAPWRPLIAPRQNLRRSLFPARCAQRRPREAAVDDEEMGVADSDEGSEAAAEDGGWGGAGGGDAADDEMEQAGEGDRWDGQEGWEQWAERGDFDEMDAADAGRERRWNAGARDDNELNDLLSAVQRRYAIVPKAPVECPICHKKCAHMGKIAQHAGTFKCVFIEGSRTVLCQECGTILKEPTALAKHKKSQVCRDRCENLARQRDRGAKYLYDRRERVRRLRADIATQRTKINMAVMKQLSAFAEA